MPWRRMEMFESVNKQTEGLVQNYCNYLILYKELQ